MKRLKILAHFGDSTYTKQRKEANTYGAIGYYRIVMPAKQITDHDVDIKGLEITKYGTTLEEQWDNIFQEYDVFWTNYFSDERIFTVMYYYAEKHGKKIVLDIDDNYLDVPASNKMYERFRPQKRERAMLSTILSFAHALTCSTYPLKERIWEHIHYMHKIDKPIYVIPNMNELAFWKTDVKQKKKKKGDITIGYTGSNSHQDDLTMIMPVISKLMTKYDNLHFQLIGSIEKDLVPVYFKGFSKEALDRIDIGPAESIFNNYPSWLAEQPWDIGIAPLVDTPFTRCKSSIKYFEYSMFEIPCVASRVYPYFVPVKGRQVVIDGENGLLARHQEWESKLTQLIESPELRRRLGKNAKEHVIKTWQYKDGGINEIVNSMLESIYEKDTRIQREETLGGVEKGNVPEIEK